MCTSIGDGEAFGVCNSVGQKGDKRTSRRVEEVSAQQLVSVFGSPMHAAAVLGTATDILALASAGHEIEGRDKVGRTPCHLAAIADNVKNLEALVDLGAHLEVQLCFSPCPAKYGPAEIGKWCNMLTDFLRYSLYVD